MSKADKIYDAVIEDILSNGIWDRDQAVRTKWKDGTPAYTKSVISTQMKFDNKEVPILTKKKVGYKTAIKEMLIFWQQKSNRISDMHDLNVHIWDEWAKEDATIGPAYGFQLGLPVRHYDASKLDYSLLEDQESHGEGAQMLDQVDYLIQELKNNPSSRRHVTSLWGIVDLDDMALNPCVWHTQWLVKEGRLHLIVGQRSADMALGSPFNVFQYYVLQRMIAQVTNYEMGTLTFNLNDAHVYERHLDGLAEQLKQPEHSAPTLWLNPEITNFYDFTMDDIKLLNYEHGPKIDFEVAI